MFLLSLVRDTDPSVQGSDTDPTLTLKGVIPLIGVLHGGGTVVRWLIHPFKAFFRDLRTTMFHILFEFRPESFVGRRDLPFHTTGQLRGQLRANTKFRIHAFVQLGDAARFAMREGILTHRIKRITRLPIALGVMPETALA